jgi:hypothetical protein
VKRVRVLLLMLLLAWAPPLAAQDAAPEATAARPPTAAERARAMIAEERQLVSARRHRADCPAEDPLNKSIVVCAPDTSERYRVPPSSDDTHAATGTRGGLTPPDMYGGPPCTMVCIRGGYAPPPVYYIDLSKIPDAPPGSDADKIAKGEARAP